MKTHTANRLKSVEEYYFSQKLREVAQRIAAGQPIINMGIGSPDKAPDPKVLQALTESLSHPKAHQYQSYQGLPELREAMANFYDQQYGVKIDPKDSVLPLMGSKEGIMHISMAFLNPGDQVLIPDPGYPTYTSVTKLLEAQPVYYMLEETNQWQPDRQFLEQLDTSNVKIMWLNYPHMPTGARADKTLFPWLVAWAKSRNILLVNDNPYSFVLNNTPTSLLATPGADQVALELNSLSKTFNMAGWRIGMLLGNSEAIQAVLKVKSNMDSGMFYGLQKGAITALGASATWYQSMNATYAQRKKRMLELIDRLGLTYDPHQVGMFVWAKLPDHTPAKNYVDQLLENKHLFIAPGTIFGAQGEGYVRFSLCVEENTIEKASARL